MGNLQVLFTSGTQDQEGANCTLIAVTCDKWNPRCIQVNMFLLLCLFLYKGEMIALDVVNHNVPCILQHAYNEHVCFRMFIYISPYRKSFLSKVCLTKQVNPFILELAHPGTRPHDLIFFPHFSHFFPSFSSGHLICGRVSLVCWCGSLPWCHE